MIINLSRFIEEEKKYWEKLEALLNLLESEPNHTMDMEAIKEFHYLYQRTSADLAKIQTFSAEPQTRRYLESLVARSYGECHENRQKQHKPAPLHWFMNTFPATFRKHLSAFWLSLSITILGFIFGGLAISLDPSAKEVIMPFPHLIHHPSERVADEENRVAHSADEDKDPLKGGKSTFSSHLMTHNIRVSIFVFSLGMTWGVGTVILLFYNGIILGAVALDYILAGETEFLLGWLLPHGAIEIPAIILAGQAGLILAGALIGWGKRIPLKRRLRMISSDLVTLIIGLSIMLVWAGFVEAFLSQYHEPVLPYAFKIGFGMIEMIGLILFLMLAGQKKQNTAAVSEFNVTPPMHA